MFDDRTQIDFPTALPRASADAGWSQAGPLARLNARLFDGRLDRQLMAGATPTPGSALAVHAHRLASQSEREALAQALRTAVADAGSPALRLSGRVPVDRSNVLAARDFIDDIALRLHAPRPVHYRAVARLRVLMADGTGPFYRSGRGSLTAELKAVLARM